MECEGVKVDVDFLKQYAKELEKEIAELDEKIQREAGVRFNVASPSQVGEVLFGRMQIPYRWRKTKTGKYSTDEAKL